MDRYFEVFKLSPNCPQTLELNEHENFRTYPICPDDFKMLEDDLTVQRSAVDALAYVQSFTEKLSQEHALVLYGERHSDSVCVKDYSIAVGSDKSVVFQPEQLKMAKKTYKSENGEVVYAHSHIAKGSCYNCFSVSDLLFLVKQALRNKRDVYGMLISKDGVTPIKYSYSGNEFFRINVKFAYWQN